MSEESYFQKREREAREYTDWLASLTIGSKVALADNSRYSRRGYTIYTVESFTPTQIKLKSAHELWLRARRKDGRLVGVSHSTIEPATAEVYAAIAEARSRHWARYEAHLSIHLLTVERIDQVRDLVVKLTAEQLAEGKQS